MARNLRVRLLVVSLFSLLTTTVARAAQTQDAAEADAMLAELNACERKVSKLEAQKRFSDSAANRVQWSALDDCRKRFAQAANASVYWAETASVTKLRARRLEMHIASLNSDLATCEGRGGALPTTTPNLWFAAVAIVACGVGYAAARPKKER